MSIMLLALIIAQPDEIDQAVNARDPIEQRITYRKLRDIARQMGRRPNSFDPLDIATVRRQMLDTALNPRNDRFAIDWSLEGLQYVADESSVPGLIRIARSKRYPESRRRYAIRALGHVRHKTSVAALRKMIFSKKMPVSLRQDAVREYWLAGGDRQLMLRLARLRTPLGSSARGALRNYRDGKRKKYVDTGGGSPFGTKSPTP